MREIEFFGIKIQALRRSEFLSLIETNLSNKIQTVQNGINAAIINDVVKNDAFKNALNNSDLANADGMSVYWALRILGKPVPERVACPDLAEDVIKMAERNSFSIFLFGAEENSLQLCVKNLQNEYPKLKIAGARNGYFKEEDEADIVAYLKKSKSDILFLGMPSPRKEFFVEKYKKEIPANFIFGVGGLFDIYSGQKKRAPKWLQKIGMEWFYRFSQEPRRMWQRYMIGNFRFIFMVLKEKFSRNK